MTGVNALIALFTKPWGCSFGRKNVTNLEHVQCTAEIFCAQ